MDVNDELKLFFFLGGGGSGGWGVGVRGSGLGGQGGCERRIEVFVKIQKKIEDVKFLGKFTNKKISGGYFGGGGGFGLGGSGWM